MSKFTHIRNTLGAVAITLTTLTTGCALDTSDPLPEPVAEASDAVQSAAGDESAVTQELIESVEAGAITARERVLIELVQALNDGAISGPQANLVETIGLSKSQVGANVEDVVETDFQLPGTEVMK